MGRRRGEEDDMPRAALLETSSHAFHGHVEAAVATGATDLRRSIDGLAALVRERFTLDPLSGHLFLFRNRRGDRLKILA